MCECMLKRWADIYTHTYIYVHTHTHTHKDTYIEGGTALTHAFIYGCGVNVCSSVERISHHTLANIHINAYIYTFLAYIHVRVHTRTHICAHTNIHMFVSFLKSFIHLRSSYHSFCVRAYACLLVAWRYSVSSGPCVSTQVFCLCAYTRTTIQIHVVYIRYMRALPTCHKLNMHMFHLN